MKTRIKTDTATIVVFDPACLKHRVADDCDWWSIQADELTETNAGNVLFLATRSDGVFEIETTETLPCAGTQCVEAVLKNQSGRLFIGAGEYVSGGDLEPVAEYGNVFLEAEPGPYRIKAWMNDATVFLNIATADRFETNHFTKIPSLK